MTNTRGQSSVSSEAGLSSWPDGSSNRRGLIWTDLTGALGDIGVLLPLAAALIAVNGLNPTTLFVCAGLYYIVSGVAFRLPVPVQPLKALAALAVTHAAAPSVIAAGGLLMGFLFLLLVATGLLPRVVSLFTNFIVRGLQLGLGLLLIEAGVRFLAFGSIVSATAGAAAWGPVPLALPNIAAGDLWIAAILLVAPQIGLSLGNAVAAANRTAHDLFGGKARRVTPGRLALSMGIANVLAGAVGGMPMCHGSGGFTAHKAFGARDERSTILLGGVLILLGLLGGAAAAAVVGAVPAPVLGALLAYVGVRHALLARDAWRGRRGLAVTLAMAGTALAAGNLAWGLAAGAVLEIGFHLARRDRAALPHRGGAQ